MKQAIFGREFIHLSDVDSTNNFAAKLLSENLCQNGAVIMADLQTQGKGQRGNVWQSEPGKNLLCSFVFMPDNLAVVSQFVLTCATSLALLETLRKFNIEAKIKWPNDIFVNGKKITGILIENQILGVNIQRSIIGIGLNVNQREFGELSATSILNETSEKHTPRMVVNQLMNSMSNQMKLVNDSKYDELKSNYESKIYRLNQLSNYSDEMGEFQGIIRGTTEVGKLIIERENRLVFYDLKEVVFR